MTPLMEFHGRKRPVIKFCEVFSLFLCLLGDNNSFVISKETRDFEVQSSNGNKEGNVVSLNVSDIIYGEYGGIHGRKIRGDRVILNESRLLENEMWDDTRASRQCNIFKGSWVYDYTYPLYDALKCPYIGGQANCRLNGRPDSDYEKWRWKPHSCTIPRFNAFHLLERVRGKRLMFVGDSTSRSQWESMVCLLNAVIPNNKKYMAYGSPLITFKALDYEASVEFFWAPFLVDLEVNNQGKRILNLNAIVNRGVYWRGVDILIFESAHWWTHTGSEKSWDIILDGRRIYRDMDPMLAYRKGMTTWANWISSNIDFRRSRVFFRGMSPKHYSSNEWNEANGHKCYNEREPVKIRGYRPPLPSQVTIMKQVLKRSRIPVTLLDITRLSQFRKDGHSSVYTSNLNEEQRKDPDRFADCSHWCLPGVPDTWNELLYAHLLGSSY